MYITCCKLAAQEVDVYKEMYPVLEEITHLADYGECTIDGLEKVTADLSKVGFNFVASEVGAFASTADAHPSAYLLEMTSYKDEVNDYRLQMVTGVADSLQVFWQKIRPESGTWTGYETYLDKFVYMLKDTNRNSVAGTMFITNGAIISVTKPLDFKVKGRANSLREVQKIKAKAVFEGILKIAKSVSNQYVPESSLIFKASDQPLTAAERVYGFTQFWTEVKYNFAFFHQVPELKWDDVYMEYLPFIIADQSNEEYYRSLAKLCALLKDGHTNINPPVKLRPDSPPIAIINIDKKAIIQNMDESLASAIPKGSEVIAVDGMNTIEYVQEYILPYISSSTPHILWNNGIRDMLQGESGSTVELTLRDLNGKEWTKQLKRNRSKINLNWHHQWPRANKTVELIGLANNTAQVKVNTFGNDAVVQDFEMLIDTLKTFDHFIIDLRSNGGGNSSNGYNILKHFATQDFLTSKWSTREHLGSFKAWGSFYASAVDTSLTEWELKAKKIHAGEYWYTSDPDTISAMGTIKHKGKLIVLIGNNTASAAEDFLVALDGLNISTLVGQSTYGSTGQPLMFNMPRGGSARICTKKDSYPDGREFVGYGIKPDIEVHKTVKDYLQGVDLEVQTALSLIKDHE